MEPKEIHGFENYVVMENGDVFNKITGAKKQPYKNKSENGYLVVDLYNNGKHQKKYVHRLVAEAFIQNPNNKPYVNHIDGCTTNNNVSNLEWCTPLENVTHAANVLGVMRQYESANSKKKRPVICYNSQSGEFVKRYGSIRDASRETGIPSANIVMQLKGRQSRTRWFVWKYESDVEELPE